MAYVHAFDAGKAGDENLLGGKGVNLAEMTALGLPGRLAEPLTQPPGIDPGTGREGEAWAERPAERAA